MECQTFFPLKAPTSAISILLVFVLAVNKLIILLLDIISEFKGNTYSNMTF